MKTSLRTPCMLLVTILMLVVNIVSATPVYASTLVVTTLDDSGAGSLRDTIAAANAGDVITFDESLSGRTIRLASTLILDKNLTIDGSFLEEQITISGDTTGDGSGDVQILIVDAAVTDARLKNLTFTKGMGTTVAPNPTHEVEGGAIFNAGMLSITNSTFSNNEVVYPSGPNEAGGALANHGTLTVTNTTFSGNNSTLAGGAVYNFTNATMTLANSTFSGNSAAGWGGAIFNRGTLTMFNNTLSGNSAGTTDSGGGLMNWSDGTLHYSNNIIANSTPGGDCFNFMGNIGANTNNLIETNNAVVDSDCSASLNGDPNLDVLADNGGPNKTFALLAGSPALGAGDNAACSAAFVGSRDQRGRVRPESEANCDIGAFESSAGPAAPVVNTPVGFLSDPTPTIGGTAEPYSLIHITYLDHSTPVDVCTNVPVTGQGNWSCLAASLPDGMIQLRVNATDGVGDTSTDTNHSITVDATAPTIVSILRADADNTSADRVEFTVTFSEAVTDVSVADFRPTVTGNITGASIDSVIGAGASYTVTVNTGTRSGTLRLDVPITATVTDLFGHALTGLPFESGEVYTVFKTNGMDSTGVFRPSNGALYLKHSNTTGFADVAINYGLPGDYPVVGDWDGDGDATIGVYRNGQFLLRNSNTIGFAQVVFPFGSPGDQPIAGDWNGDGVDTIGIYRRLTGLFMLRNSNDAGPTDMTFALGIPGDVGITGDWNGDGIDTTGVFRPSNGALYLKNSNSTGFADIQINYGLPGDKPVTGDWNDDGIDTIGVYRNGMFLLRNSNTIGFAEIVFALGILGDHPIAGNWDGSLP